jgi:hypothetical protein
MVKFNLLAPIFQDKLFGGLEMQYMSERKTLADRHIPGFFLTNITLFNQNLLKGLELSASVYNLFNTRYEDPGGEEHRWMPFHRTGAVSLQADIWILAEGQIHAWVSYTCSLAAILTLALLGTIGRGFAVGLKGHVL